MTSSSTGRRALTAVFVVLLVIGTWALREATMSVHEPVPEGSRLIVDLRADTRVDDDPADRLTRAQVDLCVAEAAPHVDLIRLDRMGDGDASEAYPDRDDLPNYRFTTTPGLDTPDRAQLNGCLEDLRLRHLRMFVTGMSLRVDGEHVAGFGWKDTR